MEVSGQLHARPIYLQGKNRGNYRIGGWVGRTAGLDVAVRRKRSLPRQGIGPRSSSP